MRWTCSRYERVISIPIYWLNASDLKIITSGPHHREENNFPEFFATLLLSKRSVNASLHPALELSVMHSDLWSIHRHFSGTLLCSRNIHWSYAGAESWCKWSWLEQRWWIRISTLQSSSQSAPGQDKRQHLVHPLSGMACRQAKGIWEEVLEKLLELLSRWRAEAGWGCWTRTETSITQGDSPGLSDFVAG